jgi:hypothetical protein
LFKFVRGDPADDQVDDSDDQTPPPPPPAPLRTRVKSGERVLWGDVAVYCRPTTRRPTTAP